MDVGIPASFVFAQLSYLKPHLLQRQSLQIIMIAKIAIFLAVVAVAYGGVVASVAHVPASTSPLLTPVVTYAAGPIAYGAPAVHAAPVAYAAGPVVHAAPVAYAAGPAVVHAAPVAYSTGAKVVQTFEPVEQHGYQIAY